MPDLGLLDSIASKITLALELVRLLDDGVKNILFIALYVNDHQGNDEVLYLLTKLSHFVFEHELLQFALLLFISKQTNNRKRVAVNF